MIDAGLIVAAAHLFSARMPAPPLFVSADRRQTDVAGAMGRGSEGWPKETASDR